MRHQLVHAWRKRRKKTKRKKRRRKETEEGERKQQQRDGLNWCPPVSALRDRRRKTLSTAAAHAHWGAVAGWTEAAAAAQAMQLALQEASADREEEPFNLCFPQGCGALAFLHVTQVKAS